VSAKVENIYASGSVKHDSSSSQSSQEESGSGRTKTSVSFIGAEPDPETMIIPTAETPGIVQNQLGPICDLLDNEYIRSECEQFIASDSFCFAQLPDRADVNFQYTNMIEHLFQMRTFAHCANVGFSALGMKMNPHLVDERSRHLFFEAIEHTRQRECLMACAEDESCAVSTFQNGHCFICNSETLEPRNIKLYEIFGRDHRNWCAKSFSRESMGISSSVQTERRYGDDVSFCVLHIPAFVETSHCFGAIEPCSARDACFTQSFIPAVTPIFKTDCREWHCGHDTPSTLGMPIFFGDTLLGERFGPPKLYRMKLPWVDVDDFCHFVVGRTEGGERPNTGLQKVDRLSLALGHYCLKDCSQRPGCDAIAAVLDFDPIIKKCNRWQLSVRSFTRTPDDVIANILNLNYLELYRETKVESETVEAMGHFENMYTKVIFDHLFGDKTNESVRTPFGKLPYTDLNLLGHKVSDQAFLDDVNLDLKIKNLFEPNGQFDVPGRCNFYNSGEVIQVKEASEDCRFNPRKCFTKVGQLFKVESFRSYTPGH